MSPAVTAEQFKQEKASAGPMFLNKPDSEVQVILDRVERLYCPYDTWGDAQFDGIIARTAHIIELEYISAQRQAALATKAVQGDPIALSGFSSDDNNLRLTVHGQDFIELRDGLIGTLGSAFG